MSSFRGHQFPTLIHTVYLEFIINYLQNFTRVICAVIPHQHPISNGKFFLSRFWSNITSPTRVSSVAGSIQIILNASLLETFETLSLSWPWVLLQFNFTVFGTGRIWYQWSVISSDLFSISPDDTKDVVWIALTSNFWITCCI